MQSSEESLLPSTVDLAGASSWNNAVRLTGAVLILAAIATVVSVGARVAAGADQPTLLESMAAISGNKVEYSIGGAARVVSGLALMTGAWLMLKTWTIRRQRAGSLVLALFAASGAFTAVSGLCAVALAASVPALTEDAAISTMDAPVEALAYSRWLTGKIGFTLAGLALVGTAGYLRKGGGTVRLTSLLSGAIGIGMLFIWLDAATVMHRITGVAFLLWLVVLGGMLLTGWLERRLAGIVSHASTGSIDG